jgi:N-acetylglutamate synthase/N-acetylornithine aminotransferase
VIGARLPVDKSNAQAPSLVGKLDASAHEDFALAICTTDRWTKIAEAEADGLRWLAIGKGAGMIHPDVGGVPHATMLVFIFSDAVVEQSTLMRAPSGASDLTFNACSVDGDTSTNDTVVAMASANWGRLLAAAGRAGVSFDPRRAAIRGGDVTFVKDGAPIGAEAEKRANQFLKQRSYTIELSLGDGPGESRYLTCDLGHGYVDVNAGYRS